MWHSKTLCWASLCKCSREFDNDWISFCQTRTRCYKEVTAREQLSNGNILEYFGILWNIPKILQDIMEYSRSLLFYFILEYSRISQNVTTFPKVFKNIQKFSKIFENIWEYSRIFWNNWKVVPERYWSVIIMCNSQLAIELKSTSILSWLCIIMGTEVVQLVKVLDAGIATEDYPLLVGGMRLCLIPPLTIDNLPWLRAWFWIILTYLFRFKENPSFHFCLIQYRSC